MLNNITITIFDIQQKFTRHGKKQENVIHNQKKNQWIKTDSQVTEIELEGKDFRTSFINMLKCVKWNISLKKESENIKKNQMKLLGMKIYIIYKTKRLTNGLHTRLDTAHWVSKDQETLQHCNRKYPIGFEEKNKVSVTLGWFQVV